MRALSRLSGLSRAPILAVKRRLQSRTVHSSNLVIEKTSSPKQKTPEKNLVFGETFTDHMLEIDWMKVEGWQTPKISPYHKLQIDPACSSLHYGLQCFEGMKAYIDEKDQIRLFRPEKNIERLSASARRLFLPQPADSTLDCIKELLRIEKDWIPRSYGYSLYVRPTIISMHPFLGVGPAQMAKFFTILCPVGPYYPEGFSAVTLYADNVNVRAWPGGAGNTKIGGNYAPTIKAQMEAVDKGYTQVLWLFGEENYVTEVGTMNIFFFLKKPDGGKELLTAPLDGTILPGVTRDCIIELSKTWGEFEISERPYTLHEIIEAIGQNRVIECFGAGTAAIVSPVKGFHFDGKDYEIPLDPNDSNSQSGVLTKRFADTIMNIQYGKVEHEWSVVVPE